MLTIFLILVVVPLFLLSTLALTRQTSLFQFILLALTFGLALLFMWASMPWDVVSIYYRWLIPLLYLAALVIGYRRIGTAKHSPPKWAKVLGVLINVPMSILFVALCWASFTGYPAPAGAIKLASPLQDGRFVIGHGGASPLINGHFKVPPQTYALDILGVNAWGARSNIFGDATRLENYAIFGTPIIAPCSGTVLIAVDGLPDLEPGQTDIENLAGNHVVLSCFDSEIVLAHMLSGSVFVEESQPVNTGDYLGRVGNSGNTSEPHLHMHAERGGEDGEILNGEGVPILIDGRFLVRGDLIP